MVISEYFIFLIGVLATFFSLWSTVPISEILKTKKTDDVSKWLIICLTGGLSLWVLYGVLKGDVIIAIANAIGVSLNLYLLFLKWKYSSKLNIANMQD
jgi:MtN3 and saliva related transmembrane protein